MSKRARNRAAVNREKARSRREDEERLRASLGAIADDFTPRPVYCIPLPSTPEEWRAQGFSCSEWTEADRVYRLARLESSQPAFPWPHGGRSPAD